ncbi:sensor histidine kinase [Plantibacter sp. YIM 135347]|uniref:sensor histidine kinase n=1 Tax=Plantibacter sp. YIM 135347 TaxID=3423919 RepID=UPI003D32B52C
MSESAHDSWPPRPPGPHWSREAREARERYVRERLDREGFFDEGGPGWAHRERRFGSRRPVFRLWFPVVVSFLVQVPAAIVVPWHAGWFGGAEGSDGHGGFGGPPFHWLRLLSIALAVIGPFVLLAARRFPGPVVAVTAVIASASMLLGPEGGAPAIVLAFAAASGIIRGARRWTYVSLFVGWVLVLSVAAVVGFELPGFRVGVTTVLTLLAILLGEGIRVQSERAEEYRRRQRERRTSAAQEERVRIARELHDVIAHSLAQINVQAGMGLHLMDTQPERAREALGNIKAASKSSLDEVRGLLDVLRADPGAAGSRGRGRDGRGPGRPGGFGDGVGHGGAPGADAGAGGGPGGAGTEGAFEAAPRRPGPNLETLPSLVTSLEDQGIDARLDVQITEPPGAAMQLALYRIAQESVTNVLRHAEATRVDIVLHEADGRYVLSVTDDGHGAPAGLEERGNGLLGMTERAELLGGTLSAGPADAEASGAGGASGTRGRGFRVVASLPKGDRS